MAARLFQIGRTVDGMRFLVEVCTRARGRAGVQATVHRRRPCPTRKRSTLTSPNDRRYTPFPRRPAPFLPVPPSVHCLPKVAQEFAAIVHLRAL